MVLAEVRGILLLVLHWSVTAVKENAEFYADPANKLGEWDQHFWQS